MEYHPTLTLSAETIARLRAEQALSSTIVPRFFRTPDGALDVMYGPTRSGDRMTTCGGFTIAMRCEDYPEIRGHELHYDAHRGFHLRRRA